MNPHMSFEQVLSFTQINPVTGEKDVHRLKFHEDSPVRWALVEPKKLTITEGPERVQTYYGVYAFSFKLEMIE